MEDRRHLSNSVGFCLLPSELIQNILLHLTFPEIARLKLLNKFIACVISDESFVRECNIRSTSTPWLFLCKKRRRSDACVHGFTDQSDRWFRIPVTDLLKPVMFTGEDLYLLTACRNVFLFASNTSQEVIAVNLVSKTVMRIPPSPLGPRGTSSWRRSAMKLVSGPQHFRFLFAELMDNRPVLFEYDSETNTWKSVVAQAQDSEPNLLPQDYVFLNLINRPNHDVVIAVGSRGRGSDPDPVIVRPRYDGEGNVGHGLLHVYGDGHMMVIKSNPAGSVRMLSSIQLWGLSLSGRRWEYISEISGEVMEEMKRPFGVMIGCLEGKDGMVRGALMSNNEGSWGIIWVSYDKRTSKWSWVLLPDCKMKGLNMAGIALSSGVVLP
ncbi:hypothetical protein HS088_TW04G01643 [Tripterygium wilfordii]|uniref:F-box domain-containing protein n=1 Tax=Tripterygium wilfordii TaxID=458696 RepID=A0A7J7DTI2_TRIWF|nr:uncharacterized protein LOC119997852 [Tripterygium wilfordii]KAF5749670.1 hypothetical protein HS088_TW04G01643 [Tripterygium wilfordii]